MKALPLSQTFPPVHWRSLLHHLNVNMHEDQGPKEQPAAKEIHTTSGVVHGVESLPRLKAVLVAHAAPIPKAICWGPH
jgi:hypothetical protein